MTALHLARDMAKPAASPSFLYRIVYRAVYFYRCPDRYAVCRNPQLENWLYQDALYGTFDGEKQPLCANYGKAKEVPREISVYGLFVLR